MKHPIHIQAFLNNFRSGWKRFWFTPEQHWNMAVVTFLLFLMLILVADVWIFWKFVWELEATTVDPPVSIQALDRSKFDAVLKTLNEKETRFNASSTDSGIENIFD